MRNGRISVMATTAPSNWRTATRTTIRAVAVSSCPLEVADSENVGDLGPAAATAVTAAVPTRLVGRGVGRPARQDRKSTRLNSSHVAISYAVFCLKKKNKLNSLKKRQKKKQLKN